MPHTKDGTGFQRHDTSAEAALTLDRKGRAGTLRDLVIAALTASGKPMSTGDLCKALDEDDASIHPRMSELLERKLVEDSGLRGKTRFGRRCILWQLKS